MSVDLNDYKSVVDEIARTNNKDLFYRANKRIKCNYTFVKYVLFTFRDNLEFIIDVCDFYLNNTSDDSLKKYEMFLYMYNIVKNIDEDVSLTYKKYVDSIYHSIIYQRNIFLDINKNDLSYISDFGLGFWYVLSEYSESKIITNYLAERFIYDLVIDNSELVSKLESLGSVGSIRKYLVVYIMDKDCNLGNYMVNNISCLDNVINKIFKQYNDSKIIDFDIVRKYKR